MDKLTAIKIKYDDGTYSDEIPVSVLSENVEWDNTHTLVDVLGSINVDITGTIQDQISQLFNEKVSITQLNNYVASQLNTDVTNWLNNNVDPVGSAVVVDSSLTISGAAADAKKVSDKLANLKSDLKNIIDDYIQIDMIWNDHGYVSTSDGTVIEYENWKYTDYVDISAFKRGYLSTLCIGVGSAYNAFYADDYTFIEPFRIPLDTTSYIAIPYNAKYIRISCRTASEIKLYSDNRATGLKWYKYDSDDYVTDFIDITTPKCTIKLPSGYTCSVRSFTPDNVVIVSTPYLGSRDWYRLNNSSKVKLYLHYTGTLVPNSNDIASITFTPKAEYSKIEYLKIISFNVGLWHNGITKQPDATANEYAVNFRKFIGGQNPDAVFMFEAPPTINESGDFSSTSLYGFKLPFIITDDGYSGRKYAAKNTFLSPEKLTFSSGSGRPIYKMTYMVADIPVVIFATHLSMEASTDGVRQQDLAELATLLSNVEYGIVLGDMNTYDMSEITSNFSAFNICNGGNFGTFITWPNVSERWPNGAIDNIITTKNISIQNVTAPDVQLSDHRPIIAELNVYY